LFKGFNNLQPFFLRPDKPFRRESFLYPMHQGRAAKKFELILSPLVGNLPDDDPVSMYLRVQHIPFILLINGHLLDPLRHRAFSFRYTVGLYINTKWTGYQKESFCTKWRRPMCINWRKIA